MKSRMLTILAALCVVAVPLAAQETPLERQDAEAGVERLEIGDRAEGAAGGQILTGSLVAIHPDHVVVRAPDGVRHLQLGEIELPAGIQEGDRIIVEYRVTPEGAVVLESVRPWDGEARDARVEPTQTQVGESQVEGRATTTVTGTVVEITDTEIVLLTDRGRERFQLADLRVPAGVTVGDRVTLDFTGTRGEVMTVREIRPVTVTDEVAVADPTLRPAVLPATGSSMPRLALFGFLALLGAVTLRVLRSS